MEWRLKSDFPWLAKQLEEISSEVPFYAEFLQDFRKSTFKKSRAKTKSAQNKKRPVTEVKNSKQRNTKKSEEKVSRNFHHGSDVQWSSDEGIGVSWGEILDSIEQVSSVGQSSEKGRLYSWGDESEFSEESDSIEDELTWSYDAIGLEKWLSDDEVLRHLSYLNYHTMTRCLTGNGIELDEARDFTDNLLRVLPNNFIGLWNKVELFFELSQLWLGFKFNPKDSLERLKELSKDEKEILIAKAGVAYMYPKIDNGSLYTLRKSVALYQEVLDEAKRLPSSVLDSDPVLKDFIATWQRRAISTGKRLKDREERKDSAGIDCVSESRQEDDTTDDRDWIAGSESDCRSDFDPDLSEDSDENRSTDRVDYAAVLTEARQLRREAKTPEELKYAIEKLKSCLENEYQKSVVYHHLGLAYRSLWILTSGTSTPQPVRYRIRPCKNADGFVPPSGCRVLKPPVALFDPSLIPVPYKQYPRKTWTVQSNPLSLTKKNPYLLRATECFEKADELTGESGNCLMLVELGRTYVSAGDVSKAFSLFTEAKSRDGAGKNGVSLFEQMGLLEESLLNDYGNFNPRIYNQRLEEIKSHYREAIRCSIFNTTKTCLGFYRLLEILYYQTQSPGHDLIIQSEYFLIYMAIQRAETPWTVIEAIADDADDLVGLSWRLIEMFHRRNQVHDASAAYTYLSILGTNGKLTAEIRSIDLGSQDRMRIVLESGERVAREAIIKSNYLTQVYDMLRELDLDYTRETAAIAIIVDNSKLVKSSTVSQMIKNHLRSPMVITPDNCKIDKVAEKLQTCHCIVVMSDRNSNEAVKEKFRSFFENVLENTCFKKRRSCQVAFDDDDSTVIPGLPVWHVNFFEKVFENTCFKQRRSCQVAYDDDDDDDDDSTVIPGLPVWHVNSRSESSPEKEHAKRKEIENVCNLLRTLFL